MELGPAYVEHVAGLRLQGLPLAVPKLSAALYNYTDNEFLRVVEPLEMLALLHCTALLVRRYAPLTCVSMACRNSLSAAVATTADVTGGPPARLCLRPPHQ